MCKLTEVNTTNKDFDSKKLLDKFFEATEAISEEILLGMEQGISMSVVFYLLYNLNIWIAHTGS